MVTHNWLWWLIIAVDDDSLVDWRGGCSREGVKVCHSPRGRTDHTLPEGSHLGTSLRASTAFGSSPNLTWYDLKWAHNQEIQSDLNCPLLTWSTEHTGPLKLDRGHVWPHWDVSQAQQVGDRSQWPLTHINKINFVSFVWSAMGWICWWYIYCLESWKYF